MLYKKASIGKVKRDDGTELGEVSGTWSHSMHYKSTKGKERQVLFDVATDGKNIAVMHIKPQSEQEPNESGRLWSKLTAAIHAKDMEAATEAKAEVEDSQREIARKREASGEKHHPRFFEQRDGLWLAKLALPPNPEDQIKVVQAWIWPAPSSTSPTSPPSSPRPSTSSTHAQISVPAVAPVSPPTSAASLRVSQAAPPLL